MQLLLLACLLACALVVSSAAPVKVEVLYDVLDARADEAISSLAKFSSQVTATLVPFGSTKQQGDDFSCAYGDKACELQTAELCGIEEANGQGGEFVVKVAAFVHCMRTWAPQVIGYIAYCWVSNYIQLAGADEAGAQVKKIEACTRTNKRQVNEAAKKASEGVVSFPTIRVNGKTVSSTAEMQESICALVSAPRPAVCL